MSSFLDMATKLVSTVGAALSGPVIPAVVAIGKDVVDLLKEAGETIAIKDQPQLQALIEDLEPKVMAHADATEAKLRGEQE